MVVGLRWLVIAGLALLVAAAALVSCGSGGPSCVPGNYNQYGQPVYNACLGTPAPPGPYVVALGICPGSAVTTPTPIPTTTATTVVVPTPAITPCPAVSGVTVPAGCQIQFHAVAQFSNSLYSDVTSGSNWTTSNAAVVAQAVASPGLYSAVANGSANVGAVVGNVVSSPIPVTVQPNAACPPLGSSFGSALPPGSP